MRVRLLTGLHVVYGRASLRVNRYDVRPAVYHQAGVWALGFELVLALDIQSAPARIQPVRQFVEQVRMFHVPPGRVEGARDSVEALVVGLEPGRPLATLLADKVSCDPRRVHVGIGSRSGRGSELAPRLQERSSCSNFSTRIGAIGRVFGVISLDAGRTAMPAPVNPFVRAALRTPVVAYADLRK